MNRKRIRNLIHWKLMILLTIVIWIGISKVAVAPDPYEIEERKKEVLLFECFCERSSSEWIQLKNAAFNMHKDRTL